MIEISNGDIYLVRKILELEQQNEDYFNTIVQYREWFLANQDLIKDMPVSAPPYSRNERVNILHRIHNLYCPNCNNK